MKAEMGLDERNPSCFLRSYSVVMVLRKVICSSHAFPPVQLPKTQTTLEQSLLQHCKCVCWYLGQAVYFIIPPSIITDCVSLLEVCRRNQDKCLPAPELLCNYEQYDHSSITLMETPSVRRPLWNNSPVFLSGGGGGSSSEGLTRVVSGFIDMHRVTGRTRAELSRV